MELYEYGGQCSVLLTVKSPRVIGNRKYAENEPHTLLKDVNVVLAYEDTTTEQSAEKPLLATRFGRPSQIGVGKLPFTQKMWDLMFTKQQTELQRTYYEGRKIDQNSIFYTEYDMVDGAIFVYDESFQPLNFVKVDESRLKIEAEPQTLVYVFYQGLIEKAAYSFEVPHFGYFDLQITATGNKDKRTSTTFLHFPAVSLISVPTVELSNGGSIANSNLIFDVIYKGQKEPVIAL